MPLCRCPERLAAAQRARSRSAGEAGEAGDVAPYYGTQQDNVHQAAEKSKAKSRLRTPRCSSAGRRRGRSGLVQCRRAGESESGERADCKSRLGSFAQDCGRPSSAELICRAHTSRRSLLRANRLRANRPPRVLGGDVRSTHRRSRPVFSARKDSLPAKHASPGTSGGITQEDPGSVPSEVEMAELA